jgi:hypothetical protein
MSEFIKKILLVALVILQFVTIAVPLWHDHEEIDSHSVVTISQHGPKEIHKGLETKHDCLACRHSAASSVIAKSIVVPPTTRFNLTQDVFRTSHRYADFFSSTAKRGPPSFLS